mmetsp:Transcript_23398/g.38484  ORF Transcript_23398/g.38484 Transcript_23398/m.38484 type:complete len:204 (-) Transcript_23398:232-843(-)
MPDNNISTDFLSPPSQSSPSSSAHSSSMFSSSSYHPSSHHPSSHPSSSHPSSSSHHHSSQHHASPSSSSSSDSLKRPSSTLSNSETHVVSRGLATMAATEYQRRASVCAPIAITSGAPSSSYGQGQGSGTPRSSPPPQHSQQSPEPPLSPTRSFSSDSSSFYIERMPMSQPYSPPSDLNKLLDQFTKQHAQRSQREAGQQNLH